MQKDKTKNNGCAVSTKFLVVSNQNANGIIKICTLLKNKINREKQSIMYNASIMHYKGLQYKKRNKTECTSND